MNVRTATLRSSSTSAPLLVARAGTTAENKTQLQQETDAGTRRMHAPAKHRRPPHIRTGPTPDLCPQPNAHRMQAAVCFWPPISGSSPGPEEGGRQALSPFCRNCASQRRVERPPSWVSWPRKRRSATHDGRAGGASRRVGWLLWWPVLRWRRCWRQSRRMRSHSRQGWGLY